MRRIATIASVIAGTLIAVPADAVVYIGNPHNSNYCSYMDMSEPEIKTDAEGDYLAGLSSQPFSLVETTCDKPWVEIHFGPDVDPRSGHWQRRIYIVSNDALPGVYDVAYCEATYDGVFHFAFDVFAAL